MNYTLLQDTLEEQYRNIIKEISNERGYNMNLLEVYIDKIISERKLEGNKIKVEAIYNCYGI